MRPILSAERASRNCVRTSRDRFRPVSTWLGFGCRPRQQARIISSFPHTPRASPSLLPSNNLRHRAYSSMPETSAAASAQEALDAVEPQCPKEAGSANAEASGPSESKSEPTLPPLSGHEFKQYNRLAEHMNYFVGLLLFAYLIFPLYSGLSLILDLARTFPPDMESIVHRSLIRSQASRDEPEAVH